MNANALTQQQAIDRYFKDRKLERIEGIWTTEGGAIVALYKDNNSYKSRFIFSKYDTPGSLYQTLNRGSNSYFYGTEKCFYQRGNDIKSTTCDTRLNLVNENNIRYSFSMDPKIAKGGISQQSSSMFRLWPENFTAHNSNFESKPKKKIARGKSIIAMIRAVRRLIRRRVTSPLAQPRIQLKK